MLVWNLSGIYDQTRLPSTAGHRALLTRQMTWCQPPHAVNVLVVKNMSVMKCAGVGLLILRGNSKEKKTVLEKQVPTANSTVDVVQKPSQPGPAQGVKTGPW